MEKTFLASVVAIAFAAGSVFVSAGNAEKSPRAIQGYEETRPYISQVGTGGGKPDTATLDQYTVGDRTFRDQEGLCFRVITSLESTNQSDVGCTDDGECVGLPVLAEEVVSVDCPPLAMQD